MPDQAPGKCAGRNTVFVSHLSRNQRRDIPSRTLQQAHAVSTGMLSAIQSRKSKVLADYEALHNPHGNASPEQLEIEQREMIARCQGRHSAAMQLVMELTKVSAYSQQALTSEGR